MTVSRITECLRTDCIDTGRFKKRWLITEINILRCTVSKTSKNSIYLFCIIQIFYTSFSFSLIHDTTPSLWRLTRYFILTYIATLSICCRRRLAVQPALFWLLIHAVSKSHTTTHHSRWGFPGRGASSSQRLLPGNTHTQHSQQTNVHAPGGI